jgi:type I restriction enzyme, R subunit
MSARVRGDSSPSRLIQVGFEARKSLLDVNDAIDPATREWVTVDETGRAYMDADEARVDALGAAFETWLSGQKFNSDQTRLLHLIKEQIKANAGDFNSFDSWRFDQPPLSMNGGFERARAVFGGEAGLERILADMNAAVFAVGSSGPPAEESTRATQPLN